MATTLASLQEECWIIGHRVTDAHLPLKIYGKNCEIKLELYGDNGNYWVEVRPSVEHDEKVAVIMQMFEEGSNDSIAMAVANQIKQRTIDKACEYFTHMKDCDFYEDKEAQKKAVDDFIDRFRKAMEE